MIDEYSTYVGELVCGRHPAVPGDVVHQLRGELDVDNGLELQVLLALFLSTVVNLTRHTRYKNPIGDESCNFTLFTIRL